MAKPLLFIIIFSAFLVNVANLWAKSEPAWEQKILELEGQIYSHPSKALELGRLLEPQINRDQDPATFVRLAAAMAVAAALLGDAKELWIWVDKGLPLAEKLPLSRSRIMLQSMKGVGYEFKSESKEAENHHRQAIALSLEKKDLQLEALASIYLAFYYNRAKDYQPLSLIINRIHQIYRTIPRDDAYYIFVGAIGNLYTLHMTSRASEGLSMLRESVEYFDQKSIEFLGFNFSMSLINAIAETSPKEALQLVQSVRQRYPLAQTPQYRVFIDSGLGLIYKSLQDYKSSLSAFQRALDYWLSTPSNASFQQKLFLEISFCQRQLGQPELALQSLSRAGSNLSKQSLKMQFEYYKLKADIHRDLKNLTEENEARRLALDLYQKYMDEHANNITRQAEAELALKLMEDKQKALEAENRTHVLELENIRQRQRIVVVVLVLLLGLLALALLSIQKSRQLRAKQREIQEILDTIEEGIVRIGPDLKILPDHSRHAEVLLDKEELLNQNFIKAVFSGSSLNSEEVSIAEQSLGMILGESKDAWDFNSTHLPLQITRHNRVLALLWQPIVDEQGVITKIICSIRDISSHITLQQKVDSEVALREDLFSKLSEISRVHSKRACSFILSLHEPFQNLRQLSLTEARSRTFKTKLHTWKGTARTLGLDALSQGIHDLEGALAQEATTDGASFTNYLESLEVALQRYKQIVDQIYFHDDHQLETTFLGLIGEVMQALQKELEKAGIAWGQVMVQDQDVAWNSARLELVRTIILHGLSNSVDHGFIRKKSLLPKGLRASFFIKAWEGAQNFVLEIQDNGAGIAWDEIARKARENGLSPGNRDELLAFLCRAGISTAASSSLLSGRGVGLAAIHEVSSAVQGRMQLLDSDQERGTCLRVSIPVGAWQNLQSDISSKIAV